jgi:hypothetical protein
MASSKPWYRNHQLWLELFVLANLAGLAPDIYLAHSTNDFGRSRHHVQPRVAARNLAEVRWRDFAEYVPLVFSLAAAPVLLVALVCWHWRTAWWRVLGFVVGGLAVAVGIVGLLLHLESHFFRELTLASLVYTAPFAAPLAYTGLGLLLIMNRMVDADSEEWPRWVLLLALGGFVGNFIFSLADHAQNAFFHSTEWIPVASSAFAVSFLLVPFFVRINRPYLLVCSAVLLVQVVVGLLGFYLHTRANLHGPSQHLFDNFVFGAPAMAPLLLPNLTLLAFLGLARTIPTTRPLANS